MSILQFFKKSCALLCAAILVTSTAIYANDGDNDADDVTIFIPSSSFSCGSGVSDGLFLPPFNSLYQALIANEDELISLVSVVDSTTNYNNLLSFANFLASQFTNGRVVISTPDGVVMIDTLSGSNSYAHFQNGTVAPKTNNLTPVAQALLNPCGVGIDSTYNTTTSVTPYETSVAIVLSTSEGVCGNSYGVVRLSIFSSTPPLCP